MTQMVSHDCKVRERFNIKAGQYSWVVKHTRDLSMNFHVFELQQLALVFSDKLATFPSALEADDVEDFCSLAQYYASKTPQSFRRVSKTTATVTALKPILLFGVTGPIVTEQT